VVRRERSRTIPDDDSTPFAGKEILSVALSFRLN
jgi:hypothetical protein